MKSQISQIPHAMILQSPLICFHNIDWPIEEAQASQISLLSGIPLKDDTFAILVPK